MEVAGSRRKWRTKRAVSDSSEAASPNGVVVGPGGTEDEEGYAYHYRNEVVFPDDPQKQERFRCIIVRGPGWQKDTLPAPLICTGLQHATGANRPKLARWRQFDAPE